jgi:hypothetical protein
VATALPALTTGSQPVPPAVVGHTGQPLVVTTGPSLGKIALLMAAMMLAVVGVAGSLLYLGVIPWPGPRVSATDVAEDGAEDGDDDDDDDDDRTETAAPSARVELPSGPPTDRVEVPPSLRDFTVRGKSAQQMLDALADDGWTVTLQPERPNVQVTSVAAVLQHGHRGVGTIQFHTYKDEPDAKIAAAFFRSQAAGIHDGPRVVYVHVTVGVEAQQPMANALLERVLR